MSAGARSRCWGALMLALSSACAGDSSASNADAEDATGGPSTTTPVAESTSTPPPPDDETTSGVATDSGTTSAESTGRPAPSTGAADEDSTTGPTAPPPLSPQKYAVFNYPAALGDGRYGDDDAVVASALELIDHACQPSCDGDVTIRLTLYRLTLPEVGESLLAAAERGADVQVILDGQAVNDTQASIIEAGLGPGHLFRCGGAEEDDACIGIRIKPTGDSINHNKFLLVSELDSGARDVVWQSSSNGTFSQVEKANNALVIRDDTTLYASYAAYFDDLRSGALGKLSDSNYYDTTDSSIAGDTGTRVYLFPRADENVADEPGFLVNGEDPILTLLGNLGCAPGDRVAVAMALWKDDRIRIVDRLATLAAQGCEVEVLLRADDAYTDPVVLTALLDAGLSGVFDVPHLHSKYIVADSLFQGEPRQLLWTGSHNFTYGALRENDEAMIRVDDATVFAEYVANIDTLRDTEGTALP